MLVGTDAFAPAYVAALEQKLAAEFPRHRVVRAADLFTDAARNTCAQRYWDA